MGFHRLDIKHEREKKSFEKIGAGFHKAKVFLRNHGNELFLHPIVPLHLKKNKGKINFTYFYIDDINFKGYIRDLGDNHGGFSFS